jgi:hypothetical protein
MEAGVGKRIAVFSVAASIALSLPGFAGASDSCNYHFPGTAGTHQHQWCISVDGNLHWFESPFGQEHFGAGAEGYAICSSGIVHGYDVGLAQAGFGPSTVVSGCGWPISTPCVIARNTTDGRFQLIQKFTHNKGNREITIEHQVTNLGSTPVSGVVLSRSFDANMNNDYFDDFGDTSSRSAWLRDVERLGLTALTTKTPATSSIESFALAWGPFGSATYKGCQANPSETPTTADDWVGRVNYDLGIIQPGKKKVVQFQYRVD